MAQAFERMFGVRVPTDAVGMTGAMAKMVSLQTAGKLKEIKNPVAYLRKIHASMPVQERQVVSSCLVSVPVHPVRSSNLPPMVDMQKVQAMEIINSDWFRLPDSEREAFIEMARKKIAALPTGRFTVPLQLLAKNQFAQHHPLAGKAMR